jgi:DNA-binding transcriptional MerR regulator
MSINPLRAPRVALTITELCRQSGATPRALRHYESKGLLFPRRHNQARVYSHREKARLQLIQSGRRAGFTLNEIRELFETYDRAGPDAQIVRALPLIKERLAALELKRREIDDALEALNAASDRMAAKLRAILGSTYLLDDH